MSDQMIETGSVFIDIESVGIPVGFPDYKPASVETLVNSIEQNGMQHPIGVRKNPDEQSEFAYLLVHGRHRLEAQKKRGESLIEAKVWEYTELEAECASLAENAHRQNANPAWESSYLAKWKQVCDEREAEEQAEKPQETAKEEETRRRKSTKTFTKKVAGTLGVSEETAARKIRIAEVIGQDNLDMLVAAGNPTELDLQKIAALQDPEQISRVCKKMLVPGTNVNAAIEATKEPLAPVVENTSPKITLSRREEDMDVEEWVEWCCIKNYPHLSDVCKTYFLKDADAYRFVNQARIKMGKSHVWEVLKEKRFRKPSGYLSQFGQIIHRFVNVEHPKAWQLCVKCGGKGVVPFVSGIHTVECPDCRGNGYSVITT